MAVWGPSRDALVDASPEAESYNFHPLPSGAYCISRTTPAGWEYDGGGQRLYTHCLIVPPEVLFRFGNNPFAIIRAASEQGHWRNPAMPCPPLKPLRLTGGATAVDTAVLGQMAVDPGPENAAALVQAARQAICLAVAGAARPAELMAGVMSCLPPECRLELSFSTGLKFSPRRPFRIVALSGDLAERLWVANYANVTVLDLGTGAASRSTPLDGWSLLVERLLSTGHFPFLAEQLSKRRSDLTLDDLPALGLQLLEDLDAWEFGGIAGLIEAREHRPAKPGPRAHAAHRQFEKSREAGTAVSAATSIDCDPTSPQVVQSLEHLDDLVYEAIGGPPTAIKELQAAWPKLVQELGEDLLIESREQYLRYALSVWEECVDSNSVRDPARAIQALDVLCLLFGDAT